MASFGPFVSFLTTEKKIKLFTNFAASFPDKYLVGV